jgi:anti-anti-sigma factor
MQRTWRLLPARCRALDGSGSLAAGWSGFRFGGLGAMSEQPVPCAPGSALRHSAVEQRDFARSMDSLEEIFAFVQAALDARGVGAADAYAIAMTIEELFTNMVKYNAAGSGSIGLQIESGADAVTCRLTDPDSDRFDVTGAPDVDIDQPVGKRRPGGLGIHLVRRLVDAIDYDYAGRCSRISFRRTLTGSAAGRSDEPGLICHPPADPGERPMFEIGYGDDGVIALTGRFDAAQCEKAQKFLDGAGGPRVFDLGGLEYISSAGLGILLKAHKQLLASGAKLRLVNVNRHIHDIFRFSGFDRVFDVERAGN